MILQYVRAHGSITRRDVVGLCRVSGNQASYLLSKLAERGVLHLVGKGRGAHYELGKTRDKRGKCLLSCRACSAQAGDSVCPGDAG